ncbi:MAG: hypothetical protein NVS9B14_00180 [Candidatus Acidiferrum sp.]
MREPVVGEFGTGPAFVSKSAKPRKMQRKHVIALRTDFVVKPGKEESAREIIDSILESSFGRESDFLQGLVMVSEMESLLVTVITFWNSNGFVETRERRVNWLRQKLAQCLDQSLRVQTFCASEPGSRDAAKEIAHPSLESGYPAITATFAALAG